MPTEPIRIIISDLHLGQADGFDIFQAPGKTAAFEAFMAALMARREPLELVINGDFVDFLQLRPWDAIGRRDKVLAKAVAIANANATILKALGKFLALSKNSVRVLLGNHDVELAFHEVWKPFADQIRAEAPNGLLQLENARVTYNPVINGVHVAIEHGNKRDYWNDIRYEDLFQDAEKGTSLFDYPPGTKLVYGLINEFKETFRFVDVLKPEIPAVPLLLLRLRPLAASLAIPAAAWHSLNAFGYGVVGAIRRAAAGPRLGSDDPSLTTEEHAFDAIAADYLGDPAAGDASAAATDLERYIADPDAERGDDGQATLGRRWDKVMSVLGGAVLRRLGRPSGITDRGWYQRDHPDLLDTRWAAKEFVGAIRIVVFGHTHRAMKQVRADGSLYLNSGTWANLIEVTPDSDSFPAWLASIANNSFPRTSYPTFVSLEPVEGGVRAALHHWNGTGADELWSQDIYPSK